MTRIRFGLLQVAIVLLTLSTAGIHLYLNVLMGKLDILFTLNGLGYLGLLAALYLQLPVVRDYPRLIRFALMGFALLTITLWVILGQPYTVLGYITKTIEAVLVVLLLFERP